MKQDIDIPDNLLIDYYDDGSIRYIAETNENRFNHGLYVRWHDNGIIAEESTFANGVLHGLYCDWRRNGRKWEQSTFVNGKEHGITFYWFDNEDDEDNTQPVKIQFLNNGYNITEEIESMVVDIANITEQEKTQIALLYGIIL